MDGAAGILTMLVVFTGMAACEKKIINKKFICQSDGLQTLRCPQDHMVVIRTAQYYRSEQPGCHPADDNTCFIRETYDLFTKCYKTQPCQIIVEEVNGGNCSSNYTGEVYLQLEYQCEPKIGKSAKTIDICSGDSWTGSMAYICSHNFPMYTDAPHCACSIRLHRPVELKITVPYFEPSPASRIAVPSKDYCAQSLMFWNVTVLNRLCASHQDTMELVDVMDATQVNVQYESIAILQSSFIITVQVHHEERMTINCTSTYQQPPLNSLTTRLTVPYVPTSRRTRATTIRPTLPPTRPTTTSFVKPTTRRVHAVTATMPTRSNAPPLSKHVTTTLLGSKTPHTDTVTHLPTTTRTQPVLVNKVQWPLITGVVASLMVLIILVIVLLLFCCRSRHKKPSSYGQSELANFTFENVIYMTSTEVAALHGSQETAVATGSASTNTVTVEVNKLGDTCASGAGTNVSGNEPYGDVTSCDSCEPTPYVSCDPTPSPSCDPTPYTSMTDLSVKDKSTLMENQPGSL